MLSGAYNLLPSARKAFVGPIRNLIRLTDPVVHAARRPVPKNLFDTTAVDLHSSRMLVFLGKRPLIGQWQSYQHILRFVNAEHVGVKVIILNRWWGERVLYFDFLPALDGDSNKFGGDVTSKIQENMLEPEDWAFVGTSNHTLREVKRFNKRYMGLQYSLGKNDCRDYSSSLVQFLTGIEIPAGLITAYIRDAVSAHGKSSVDDMIRFVRQKRAEQDSRNYSTSWSLRNAVWGSASSLLSSTLQGLTWVRRRVQLGSIRGSPSSPSKAISQGPVSEDRGSDREEDGTAAKKF